MPPLGATTFLKVNKTPKVVSVGCVGLWKNNGVLSEFEKLGKPERCVKFLTFRSFGNLLTSFYIGIAVSGLMLRLKAKEFSKDPEFKTSLGWYQKWKRRYSVSLRTKTTLAQRLPEDLEQQTVKFHRFVITSRQRHGYSLSRIFIFSVKTH